MTLTRSATTEMSYWPSTDWQNSKTTVIICKPLLIEFVSMLRGGACSVPQAETFYVDQALKTSLTSSAS